MSASTSSGVARRASHGRPSGEVALLFSDIEGSTIRWERFGQAMGEALRVHDRLVRDAIEAAGGYVFKTVGDAFCAAFASVPEAVDAAIAVQAVLARHDWNAVDGLRVRLAVHAGTLAERDGDYTGPAIARASRLLAIGHGDQILLSESAAVLARDALDPDVTLVDCGLHRLKDLTAPEHVMQLSVPGRPAAFPPLRSLDESPNNLPLRASAFFGRKAEMSAIKQMLRDARLVTLTGPGGIGKTRTALQVAAEAASRFPDGVWFVELAPLGEGATVTAALAALFAIAPCGEFELLGRVARAMRFKTALLVFDNCEHLVPEAARVLDTILRTAPGVRAIATSREALALSGERVFRLPSLDCVPGSSAPTADRAIEHSAVALFVDRARAADPSFALTDENAPAIAEVCRRLDGIPFAIELAVPRLRHFSPAQLAVRLSERFTVLGAEAGGGGERGGGERYGGGERDLPARIQTMYAVIDWSYELLSGEERALFRRLAVFHDGWTLDAATALCGDDRLGAWEILEITSALVAKSLVVELTAPSDEGERHKRFGMLESTRVYARGKLIEGGEDADLARAHAAHYGRRVAAIARSRAASSDRSWLVLATAELDNVRAALQWALHDGNDPALGVEMLFGFLPLWTLASQAEGAAWTRAAEAALARDVHPRAVALMLAARATYATGQGARVAASGAALDAARALADADVLRFALTAHGRNLLDSSELVRGTACLDEALALHRAGEDRRSTALVLGYLGDAARWNANARGARERYEEAIVLARAARAERAEAIALGSLAELESDEGRIEAAAATTTAALELFAAIRDVRNTASSHCNLAGYAIARDAFAEARLHARLALAILREQEDEFLLTIAVEHLAVVLGLEGDIWRAARLIGFADASYERFAFTREFTERRGYDRLRAHLDSRFGAADLASLVAAGKALAPDDALAEAFR